MWVKKFHIIPGVFFELQWTNVIIGIAENTVITQAADNNPGDGIV